MSLALTSRRAALLPGRWVSNELWRRARAVPSLDLRFAENKSLVDSVSGQNLITFTRASTGTYVDSDGVIRSAANDAPRFDHNPLTGECLGLLVEEQRQNLLLNSATLSTQTVTVTAVAHTLSFYGTGTVTLSGTSTAGPLVGTAANSRVSLTFTPTAGSLTLTVSGSVTNANLEIGSFATSWIPTTGTTATRTADVASISGTNFSSWYRQDEGTVFADASVGSLIPNQAIWSIGDPTLAFGSRSSFYSVGQPTTGNWFVSQAVAGATQLGTSAFAGSYSIGSPLKTAFGYATNNTVGAGGGVLGIPDTACVIPTGTFTISIGSLASGWAGAGPSGATRLRRLAYFDRRLPDATLQSITQ